MQRGFSMIEVMIVLAIVAILVALSYPSYAAQMRKSARADAQAFITDAATRQQQFLVDRRAYASSLAELGVTAPPGLSGKFAFVLNAVDGPPPTFSIVATAIGDQVHDACPNLSITNAGNRIPASCW